MQPRASVVRGTLCVITAVALVVGAGAASATVKKKRKPPPPPPKPVCDLVKGTGAGATDQSLQITSADVATNATTLTWVVRVAKLTGSGQDTTSPTGREWDFNFSIDGHDVTFWVEDGPFGLQTSYGIGTATLDTTKNEVRYSATLSAIARATTSQVKNGSSILTNFVATTKTTVQNTTVGFGGGAVVQIQRVDTAQSGAKYLAGYPSCVKVGS